MSGPSYHPPMNTAEELNVWWTYEARPRKAVFIALVVVWLSAGLLLHSDVVKILATDPIHAHTSYRFSKGDATLAYSNTSSFVSAYFERIAP
jgi:hypothetical protein